MLVVPRARKQPSTFKLKFCPEIFYWSSQGHFNLTPAGEATRRAAGK
jgi:hypothetical protein